MVWLRQYVIFAALAAVAIWRLGKALPGSVRPYLLALPAIGLLSVPLSYLLLEQAQLAIIPQVQIMRSLLYTVMVAVILMTLAGLRAASQGQWWEAPLWLAPVFLVPMAPVWTGKTAAVYLLAAALALAAALILSLEKRHPPIAMAGAALVFAACFFAPGALAKRSEERRVGKECA